MCAQEPSSETGSLSGGSRSASSPEPEPSRRSSPTRSCRGADDRSPPPPPPPPSTSAASNAKMAAVEWPLNNSPPSTADPPSPFALDANSATAANVPKWLLAATLRLQENTAAAAAAAAAADGRSPPEHHHHHQQQQQNLHRSHHHRGNHQQHQSQRPSSQQQHMSLDQPLDLSAKSNSGPPMAAAGSSSSASCPGSTSSPPPPPPPPPPHPSADGAPKANHGSFSQDLIAADMVNSISSILIPGASSFLPHQSLKVPSLLNTNNRNMFK